MIYRKVMLMQIGMIEVIKLEIIFSFILAVVRVPFSLGKEQSCRLDL
jgi:hypothetical protein